ncbi:hypothetical protein AAHC03_019155 [Spirometra sp. Aus1]
MRYGSAAVFHCILLGAFSSAIRVEPGFPTDCGVPTVRRKQNEEAEERKVRATPHSWPWHVGLWSDRRGEHPFCGGTLISRSLVVTAAHCIGALMGCNALPVGKPFSIPAATGDRLQVLVGAHDYTKADKLNTLLSVRHVVVHPKYNDSLREEGYDIALLKLYEKINPGERMRHICFPPKSVTLQRGSICYFAGWGGLYKQRSPGQLVYPKTLREAEVQIELDDPCMEVFAPYYRDKHSCTRTRGTSPCVGDSGGGLFCPSEEDGSFFWYGVIEGGTNDCRGSCAIVGKIKAIHTWVKDTAFTLGL